MNDAITTIVALANRQRLVRIWYQKINESSPKPRVIEPYRFVERSGTLNIHAWQINPAPKRPADECWRCFCIDRISDVSDGGGEFKPRRQVKMADGEVMEWQQLFGKKRKADFVGRYREYLRKAVADYALTEEETEKAADLAEGIATADIRVVHCQVFEEVLFDLLLDHEIDHEEDEFLDQVRSFMNRVGWAP